MKLSARTLHLLKNFSIINPSIVLKPGGIVSTISPTKTILARASISDEITNVVAIYNLSRFISTLSLFENPDLDFGDKSVKISDGNRSVLYHYADASIIMVPPEKQIKLPSIDAECVITNKDFQNITKALSVLGLPEIAIVGDGDNISLEAMDTKNPTGDTFSINVGESSTVFRAIFKSENLKIMDGDYTVTISSKGISQFVGTEVSYWIAVESTSTF
jgi:hypothetical protein